MNKILKHTLLYISVFFLPIIPYIYAKKKLRGLLVEGGAFFAVLLGSNILAFSLVINIDAANPITQNVNINELATRAYMGIAIILIAAFGTWIDSFYVLFKKIKSEKQNITIK